MRFENTEVWGFKNAIRGMRNPMNSWDRSDSRFIYPATTDGKDDINGCHYLIGQNDMRLAQQLIRAGSEHRKFMRQIFISVDITAPLYWWKEFDTYKVGTVSNSTSTMHKLATTPITLDRFETDDYNPNLICTKTYEDIFDGDTKITTEYLRNNVETMLDFLEGLRLNYLETKNNAYLKELIRWLPESWLQTRTVTMSYENLFTMVRQRKNHKLSEWAVRFINWGRTLPYAQELIFINEVEE